MYVITAIVKSTKQIILQLKNDQHPNKGVLAGLRQASSMTHPKAQVAWPIMMASISSIRDITPEVIDKILSKDGRPTEAETAIYAAIRLYAIHQQGTTELVYGPVKRGKSEQTETLPVGQALFQALAQLRSDPQYKVALDRRVQAVLASTNVDSIFDALAHLVNMLKARSGHVRIDYGQLAGDFYQIQRGYTAASRVRLRWGQQYFFVITKDTQKENESNEK